MVLGLLASAWADWASAAAPVANSQSVTSAPPLVRRRIDLSWTDPDVNWLDYRWTLVTAPARGSLEYSTGGFGNPTYTPIPTNTPLDMNNGGYDWYYSTSQTDTNGDSFTWQMSEGTATSSLATVTIVFATNTPVIANNSTNSLVVGSVRYPFSASYTDPDNYQPKTFQMVTPPGQGLVEYKPGADFLPVTTDLWVNVSGLYYTSSGVTTGADSIAWRACDGASTSTPATIVFNLTSNTVPGANDQTAGADIVTNRVRVSLGLSWSDPDNFQRISCALVRAPAHATLEWSSNGTYIAISTNTAVEGSQAWYLTPSAGYAGADNFQWRALDGVTNSRTATYTFNLVTNRAPVAENLRGICQPGSNTTLMIRYSDLDAGQTYSNWVANAPAHGSVTLTNFWNGPALIYTANAGYTGMDTFTYKGNDGVDDSNEALVRIQVRNPGVWASNLVVLAVNQTLYPSISNAVDRLRTDLIDEGYTAKVLPVSPASASNLWVTLRAEYANTNQWLTGAILIGNLPKPQTQDANATVYSDLVYWNMQKYETAKYQTDFDIWASRINAEGLTAYGAEAALILRALDANHNYRKGLSRLPHTAYYYNCMKWSVSADLYGQRLLEVWPSVVATNENSDLGYASSAKFFPARTDINEAGADALIGGGDLFFHSSHGSSSDYMNATFLKDDVFRLLVQQRVVIADSCSVGAYGGIMNTHLFTRGGGCVLALGMTELAAFGDYNIAATNIIERAAFRARLGAGAPWGDALLWHYALSRRSAVWYGDMSLPAKASPSNAVPQMTPITVSTATPAAGLPVTFSVNVSDADGTQTNGSPLGFKAQMEWFVNNYNNGQGTPAFTTNDTISGWTNFTYTFPSGGVYTIRAEVMDAWRARGWREFQVTVTNLVATNGTPVVWMVNQGLTTNATYPTWDAVALGDQDQDGMPTWSERIAGTGPTDSNSVFRVLRFETEAGTNWITWYGTTNGGVVTPFAMQRLTNLASPPDLTISNLQRSASGTNVWGDGGAPTGVPVFYRPTIPVP